VKPSRQKHLTHLNVAIHRTRCQVSSHGMKVQTADTGLVPHQSAQNLQKKKIFQEINSAVDKYLDKCVVLNKCFWSDGPCAGLQSSEWKWSLQDLSHQTGSFNHPRKHEDNIFSMHLYTKYWASMCRTSIQKLAGTF